ncbi:AraC family transcriptional regulator [Streptomyces prunicolor]|uniref:AraC family transcriptional regulator n=1 Tax=Streptomyces prunicolor TaxID=67348 RepID=UPI002259D128|nr:AraC family transcriptional regulator [Streptomyces prunicolor]MCX5236893.1 AraC family transcriptional regulator [Streptomyces prunicolor]
MVQWEIPRPPTSVSVLVDLGVELGVPATVSLAGTGLTEAALSDTGTEVTARQEQAVVGNLLAATDGRGHLGLEAGSRFHLTSFGFWGFALVSSPTLGAALKIALQYLDLTYAWSHFDLRRTGDEAQLVLTAPDVPEPLRRFTVERDLAVIATLQRELFSARIQVRRLVLAFPPADPEPYEQVLRVTPEFGGDETLIALDAALLDLPMPQANAHTQALAQEQCRELLDRGSARTGVAGRVRDLLLARPCDPPTAEHVARELTMSSRTLRERLAAERTSYRELLDEIRERLAEEMLAEGLAVAQAAERLGYQEVSSFSHAFRRWKGMGPRAYRTAVLRRPS